MKSQTVIRIFTLCCSLSLFAACVDPEKNPGSAKAQQSAASFKKVFIIVLENTNADDAIKEPFLAEIAKKGAYLSNFYAITHPSQGNYIAMTSGEKNGSDGNTIKNLDVSHIADLLEAKGRTWKQYTEDYPGNCFQGELHKKYARRHAPFVSYTNIQNNPERCAKIVNSQQLDKDIADRALPDYSFYVPNLDNDGHDTHVSFASQWLAREFGPRFKDPKFIKDMLVVVTFDESGDAENRIYTAFFGDGIFPGAVSAVRYNFYSLMRTIENQFNLGSLGRNDEKANPITGIWK
jgi:hypothetical protein